MITRLPFTPRDGIHVMAKQTFPPGGRTQSMYETETGVFLVLLALFSARARRSARA